MLHMLTVKPRLPAETQSTDKGKGKVSHFCQGRMQGTLEMWRRPAAVSVTNNLWKDLPEQLVVSHGRRTIAAKGPSSGRAAGKG